MRSNKLPWILIVLVLAAILLTAVLWDSISIYIFPGKILSDSAVQVYAQLQERFDGNPLLNAAKYIDPEGKQQVDLTVKTTDPYLGEICYEMEMQTEQHRFQGEGVVRTSGGELDLSVYADTKYMALASDELLRGNYYGITYDSFQLDIRKIPLLSWMIGESVLQKWNQSVLAVKHSMEKGYAVLQIPEIPSEELQKLVLNLVAIPAKVTKQNVHLQEQEIECHRIAFHFENAQITEILRRIVPLDNNAVALVDANFFLHENTLIMADVQISSGEIAYRIQPVFGMNAETDQLRVLITRWNNYDIEKSFISVETVRGTDYIQEKWLLESNLVETSFNYRWYPETGDMNLRIGGSEEFLLNLSENDKGLCVRAENLSDIYNALTGNTSKQDRIFAGSAVIGKGTQFACPEYKNLDQWSMEDFLTLLEGIGGLIGLEFA